ncbi:DUF1768-domain-containing protein [Mycena alexandri]|uniref:DUF1768-domain-containing protein n=1 Tax=Mycena alexandri TaxID=1745969 RepID=A0AAD6TG22_9AGAR|nr:DUF1768-domain-containing protein [Mycena alexandri]
MNYYPRRPNPQVEMCENCNASPKEWNSADGNFHPYCSKSCARQVANAQTQGDCDHCHTFPKRWDSQSRTFHPYCSRTCANKAKRAILQPIQPQPSVSNVCTHCGVRPKYGNHPYCGKTCAQAARRATLQPLRPTSQPAISNNCIQCGVRPKYEDHPYCGKTCAQAARRSGQVQPANTVSSPISARWSIFGADSAVGNLLWGRPDDAAPRQRILFYHRTDPYYSFTNFSPHPVQYAGKVYPTSEHLFQAFKFLDNRPDIAEKIRTISKFPRDAFTQARVHKTDQHPNWLKMNIEKMDIVLWHKFTQHEDLKQELLGTGDAELVEDSAEDAFWGIGKNNQGQNELGKALERLRTKLQAAR